MICPYWTAWQIQESKYLLTKFLICKNLLEFWNNFLQCFKWHEHSFCNDIFKTRCLKVMLWRWQYDGVRWHLPHWKNKASHHWRKSHCREILREDSTIIPYLQSLGPNCIHSSTPPLTEHIRDCLQNLGVERMEWPSCNPDLSPTEHLLDQFQHAE